MTTEQRDHLDDLLDRIRMRLNKNVAGRTLREAQTHDDVEEALALLRAPP